MDITRAVLSKAIHRVQSLLEACFKNNKTWKIIIILSWAVLLLSSVYSGVQASRIERTNADQYISTYAVSDVTGLHQLALVPDHTNIIKIPLLWVQGKLPYHKVSYYTVDTLLLVVTAVAWSLLLRRLVGSTLIAGFNFIFAGILLSSPDLAVNLTMTTIRNIEYPLLLLVILELGKLQTGKISTLYKYLSVLLLALLVMSDSLFLYVVYPSLLIGSLLVYLRDRNSRTGLHIACLVTLGALGGVLLRHVLSALGVFIIAKSAPTHFIAYQNLWTNVAEAIRDVFIIFGGNVFDHALRLRSLGLFAYFGLTLLLVFSLSRFTKSEVRTAKPRFAWVSLACMAYLVFLAYIFSGNVAAAGYRPLDDGNIRYITLLGLILPSIFIYMAQPIKNHYQKLLVLGCIVVFGCGLINAYRNISTYSDRIVILNADRTSHFDSIVSALNENNVKVAFGTFTYSSTIRFDSNDRIKSFPIIDCNVPITAVTNAAWYKPQPAVKKSALIIDRSPRGWETWDNCPDAKLQNIYGKPSKVVTVGTRNGLPIELWIYSYDLRAHMLPYSDSSYH